MKISARKSPPKKIQRPVRKTFRAAFHPRRFWRAFFRVAVGGLIVAIIGLAVFFYTRSFNQLLDFAISLGDRLRPARVLIYQRLQKINPHDYRGYLNLSNIYVYETHEYNKALLLIDDAIKANPNYVRLYRTKVDILYYGFKDVNNVIITFGESMKANPDEAMEGDSFYNYVVSILRELQPGAAAGFQKYYLDFKKKAGGV
jgi:tetratricopeptide (TPR) repeat protein